MGFGGIGIWQLLIVLLIIILLFGTKKLRNIGTDLGGAIKSFRSSMKDGQTEEKKKETKDEGKEKLEEISGNIMDDEGIEESVRERVAGK